jgi:transposase
VGIRPTDEEYQVGNNEEGIAELVDRMKKLVPQLIVMEATGGFEAAAAIALGIAGLSVAVVNPGIAHDFAKPLGRLAKTNRIAAKTLAHFADAIRPEP